VEEDENKQASMIKVEEESEDRAELSKKDRVSDIPEVLPILPLRGMVVYPSTAVPIIIGQPRSIKLIDEVVAGNRMIGLVASRNPELELPGPEDLYPIGTVGTIHRLFRAPDGTIRLIVHGLARFELGEFQSFEPYLVAKILQKPEIIEEGLEIEGQVRAAKDQFQRIVEIAPSIPREILGSVLPLDDPLQVVYAIANFQTIDLEDAQQLLEVDTALDKLERLNAILSREVEVLSLGQQIQQEARTEIEKVQREYFLREQLKAIQRELGEGDEQSAEAEEFRQRIASLGFPRQPRNTA
jgi:ATP-dependent Lon protease